MACVISIWIQPLSNLKKEDFSHSRQHVPDQTSMVCSSGIKPEQVEWLTKEVSIHMTQVSHISAAGHTLENWGYLTHDIYQVTK